MLKSKYLSILILLFFSYGATGQVELNNLEDVKTYLNSEWQLKFVYGGWTGFEYYPTDSLDYRIEFELIAENDSTIMCSGYLNENLIESRIVDIIYHEELFWGLDGFPRLFDHEWTTLFFYQEAIMVDSFDVHDATFDGTSMRFSKITDTSIDDEFDNSIVNIYPNPATDHLYIDIPEGNNSGRFSIYNSKGQKLDEQVLNERSSTIKLPDVSGILYIQITTDDGKVVVKKITKI